MFVEFQSLTLHNQAAQSQLMDKCWMDSSSFLHRMHLETVCVPLFLSNSWITIFLWTNRQATIECLRTKTLCQIRFPQPTLGDILPQPHIPHYCCPSKRHNLYPNMGIWWLVWCPPRFSAKHSLERTTTTNCCWRWSLTASCDPTQSNPASLAVNLLL